MKSAEIPRYEQIQPDLLLMGVTHENLKIREVLRVRKFLRKLTDLDHLFFEGIEGAYQMNNAMGLTTYETIAYNTFGGQLHFMEEGVDRIAMLRKHGISPNHYGMFDVCLFLPTLLSECRELEEMRSGIKDYWKIVPQSAESVSADDYVKMFFGLMMLFERNEKDFEDASVAMPHEVGAAFQTYRAKVRDHDIFGPLLKETVPKLAGKKGVLFGADHMDPVEKLLKDKEEPLPNWVEYKKGLRPSMQKGIKLVENVADKTMEL